MDKPQKIDKLKRELKDVKGGEECEVYSRVVAITAPPQAIGTTGKKKSFRPERFLR